ncbi:hypothetical protein [Ilumatobacter sp.]|uniref:hypothetical protein n=1 Tax=Ilumatobacter sp. TaxID=1967498 RepID=UPI003AF76ECF
MTAYGDLEHRVRSVLADLDDLAFDQLREAVADGATSRPASDRELAKARRSLEKAAAILGRLADEG